MKVLIVATHHNVFEQKIGAHYRILNIAKQLHKINDVYLLQPDRFYVENGTIPNYSFKEHRIPFLRTIGWEYLPLFTDFNLDYLRKLRTLINKLGIDVIQVEYPWGVITAKILTKLIRKDLKVVYDSHDVEYTLIKQFADKILEEKGFIYQLPKQLLLAYIFLQEKIALKMADVTLTVSLDDRQIYTSLYHADNSKIFVIPSGVNIKPLNGRSDVKIKGTKAQYNVPDRRTVVIFHGSYNHFPNQEAIDLIVNHIAPELKECFFVIAGMNVPEYNNENIKSVGFVEDLESFLEIGDIAIVPIRSGGGTRIKILDYMRDGMAIVTTKKGIEGINVTNGEHAIVVADINADFIDAIRYLGQNPEERKRIGNNAREYIKKILIGKRLGIK